MHECPQLSRGGSYPEQRVYLTIRVVVQLSHPADMQLVLRKRICVNVNPGRQGFAHNFLRRMSTRSTVPGCGVTFEVVSNIPGVRPMGRSIVLSSILLNMLLIFMMLCLLRMLPVQRTGRCWPDSLQAHTTASQATMRLPLRNTSGVSWVWRTFWHWIDSDR